MSKNTYLEIYHFMNNEKLNPSPAADGRVVLNMLLDVKKTLKTLKNLNDKCMMVECSMAIRN